ncbi:hypothetical protein MTO96_022571 [Rhipicephalus appendiculatus]
MAGAASEGFPGVVSYSVCGCTRTMEVSVNGTDANPAEWESPDWVTNVSKRVAALQEHQQRERNGDTRVAATSGGCGKEGRTVPAGCKGHKHGVRGGTLVQSGGKKARGAVSGVAPTASSERGS